MDYGGIGKRRTKGDLKMKAKNRVYKRGGQFRSSNVDEESSEAKRDKMGNLIKDKKGKGNLKQRKANAKRKKY
jgi:hypothetical protein